MLRMQINIFYERLPKQPLYKYCNMKYIQMYIFTIKDSKGQHLPVVYVKLNDGCPGS